MKVKATKDGFHGGYFRRPGDVFEIDEAAFTAVWMQRLDGPAEEDEPVSEALPASSGKPLTPVTFVELMKPKAKPARQPKSKQDGAKPEPAKPEATGNADVI